MRDFDEIKFSQESEEEKKEIFDEDDNWGEGCCEDVLMDDDFYEREYCD
ncbi:hypothetical protein KKA17_11565 [bacterium]|nr:hypothetical protein [bacterium]MBU1884523.1 hypothetical protein [bacterium]